MLRLFGSEHFAPDFILKMFFKHESETDLVAIFAEKNWHLKGG